MKRKIVLSLLFAFVVMGSTGVSAAAARRTATSQHPGVELARSVSLATGVALSPLLGAGAVGAYDYLTASAEERKTLAWYASPFFWVPALLVVLAIAAKDALGTVVPPGLKKPLDAAEVIENKLSGLVAAAAFLPAALGVFSIFASDAGATGASTSLSASGFATIDLQGFLHLALAPFAFIAFGLVWLVAHAVNVLILLSPFPVADALLKGVRTALLSLVTATSFANPWVGLVFALSLITLAYFLAGWAFRLFVFGGVFAWDLLTLRRRRFLPTTNANWMFLARGLEKVPVRTYGRLVRKAGGALAFEYRPWLVLGRRRLLLPGGEYFVGRGLLFSELHLRTDSGGDSMALFDLPPRFRSHEEDLARAYGLTVEDVGLRRGWAAAWRWLKGLFRVSNPLPTPLLG